MEERIKTSIWKNGNKGKIVLMAVAGIILLVASIPSGSKGDETDYSMNFGTYSSSKSDEFHGLEEKMSQALSTIQGIGETRVVLTGVGENRLLDPEENAMVQGVLVITEHGDERHVVEQITSVMEALFDVPAHKIMVAKLNKGDIE